MKQDQCINVEWNQNDLFPGVPLGVLLASLERYVMLIKQIPFEQVLINKREM